MERHKLLYLRVISKWKCCCYGIVDEAEGELEDLFLDVLVADECELHHVLVQELVWMIHEQLEVHGLQENPLHLHHFLLMAKSREASTYCKGIGVCRPEEGRDGLFGRRHDVSALLRCLLHLPGEEQATESCLLKIESC